MGSLISENRRIARAAGVVSGLTLVSRIGGLIRDAVVGYYLGTGLAADAFFVAFRLPNLLRRFVAEGAMGVAFIPVLSDYLTRLGEREAVKAARALATVMALVLAALTLAGMVLAPALTGLFAPGFAAVAGKFELTVSLTRWVFPYLFFIGLMALFGGLLNAYRHFTAPALSPILLNLVMIVAALLLCPRLSQPAYGLAFGALAGGALQMLAQLPPLVRRGVRLWPRWEPEHPAVRRVLWLMAPTLIGSAAYQLNVLASTILASLLPGGSVSYLWYADRVFEFPLGLFAVALGTAALPSFSTQAARGAYGELSDSVSFAIRLTNFIALPASVGLICLAQPITAVLFQRGAFGGREVELTAQALAAFAVGLWPVSLVRVLVPAFYALNDTRTPVVVALITFAVNGCCSLMLMGAVAPTGESVAADVIAAASRWLAIADLRHAGLALATSAAATVNMVLLLGALRWRLPSLRAGPLALSLGRDLVASAAIVWPVNWMAGGGDWGAPGQLAPQLALLLAAVAAGMAAYGLAAVVLGGADARRLLHVLRQRLPGAG
ncbi:MAG: murein biosynthesis integral membrane protein MurJ [Deltaproteobacteria bacterium]|nr:murein biosynthesis integral membrane protein MurJ [Deltaproteobacteria bacterium]